MGKIGYFVIGETKCDTEDAASVDQVAGQNYPLNGAEWVDHFVREMMSASNMDDAKARASRVLEALEKSICERSRSETERVSCYMCYLHCHCQPRYLAKMTVVFIFIILCVPYS